ncbi:ribonuclease P protein subunit p30 [Eudromia elegans]
MAAFADLNLPAGADKRGLQSLLEAAANRECGGTGTVPGRAPRRPWGFPGAVGGGPRGAGREAGGVSGLRTLVLWVGYSAAALNHVVDFKEKKQEIAKPVSPSELFPSLPIVQGTSKQIKVLNRLTLVVSDPSHCNLLRSTSANIRLYDIIAVFPKTEKLFHIACTTLDVDLVCINVTEKLPFYFRRPPVNVAIERGIYFELLYAPAIKDSTMRRYTISNAISLMQICKGKNIVISSAAERPLELRGPYDVANLGLLFGMSEGDAKAAVSTNCRATLLHGETRRSACGVVYTVKKPRKVEEEETTLPACKKAKTQV